MRQASHDRYRRGIARLNDGHFLESRRNRRQQRRRTWRGQTIDGTFDGKDEAGPIRVEIGTNPDPDFLERKPSARFGQRPDSLWFLGRFSTIAAVWFTAIEGTPISVAAAASPALISIAK